MLVAIGMLLSVIASVASAIQLDRFASLAMIELLQRT